MSENWRSLFLWSAVALILAVIAVSFLQWGLNGSVYLVDLVETYCL
jgi:hypothetical protein